MPTLTQLLGFDCEIHECPAMPQTLGKPGWMFVFTDKGKSGNIFTYPMSEELARQLSAELSHKPRGEFDLAKMMSNGGKGAH